MTHLIFNNGYATLQSSGVIPEGAIEVTQADADAINAAFARGARVTQSGDGWDVGEIEETVEQRRERMVISKMQGILTLGEAHWNTVLAYRETATWGEKAVIDTAGEWRRDSQTIAFIGYLIGFNDEDMDALFEAAMLVEA